MPRLVVTLAPLAALVLVLSGCGPLSSADPGGVIRSTHLDDPNSVQALVRIVGSEAAAEAGAQALAAGVTGDELWAAVHAYVGAGTDPKVLDPLLDNEDLTVRAVAASGAVLLGDAAAFPVLIDLLGDDDWVRGSEPPQSIWQIADRSLVQATAISEYGPPLDGSAGQARIAQAKWQQWWADNSASLAFDPKTNLWSTK